MDHINAALARRLKALRVERTWTLDDVARASGVSRAMVSRIERDEASPTAAILARLASGFGVSLATLFADHARPASPMMRAADQPVWQDPASGYVRRNVSPPGFGGLEIVDVAFPAGARVTFDNPWVSTPLVQQIWVLDGLLELTLGPVTHRLATGDCLAMRLDQPISFHNPGPGPTRYAVILGPHAA